MHAPLPPPAVGRPGFGVKLGYASGNLGKSVIWASFESFLLFYLVTVAGMGPLTAGAALAAAMVWDGLADVAVAWWSDTRGRQDMLGRLIVWGAPLCAGGFVSIFLSPGQTHLLSVAAIMLCRFGYTLCDVGHNTLLVRVSVDERDASTVSGMRLMFSAMGGGIVGLASAHALDIGDPVHRQGAFSTFAMAGGSLYVVTLLTAMLACRTLPPVNAGHARSSRPRFGVLRHNRAFLRALAVIALQSCITPIFTRSLPFFGQMSQGDAGWGGRALMVITVAQALSLPGWIAWSRVKSPKVLLISAHGCMIVAMAALAMTQTSWIAYGPLLVLGGAQGGMNMAIWAMLAQSVRNAAGKPAAAEALPVGIFLAVLKCASGVGQAIFAGIVAWGHLQAASGAGASSHVMVDMVLSVAALGSLSIMVTAGRGTWGGRAALTSKRN
ncbi:MFS transporter [Novosphingobium rosa]|uniref:MFS transporter n=1 Tax=Novosphingobium rosa TaxID=76978 RepID=UPI00082CF8F3|nr:MFS transporter [Novosphingobium rosa]